MIRWFMIQDVSKSENFPNENKTLKRRLYGEKKSQTLDCQTDNLMLLALKKTLHKNFKRTKIFQMCEFCS
jgi:hypothetical protein